MSPREYNFDGLIGPTHNFGGLSDGNVASQTHEGSVSNPRAAALQGLAKMRFVHRLGVGQAVLPPAPRPSLRALRRLGFHGSDEQVLTTAWSSTPGLVRLCASAASMWAANAATAAPSSDTADGRLHLTPANLQQMFHRALEADTTTAVLRAIFADEGRFVVHDPLPSGGAGAGHFADEGAANHTRLVTPGHAPVHLFAWGRRALGPARAPSRYPARQTLEASQALARLHRLDPGSAWFAQQHPDGIDAGAFHTDVLAVGNEGFLMLHELAFTEQPELLARLRAALGPELRVEVATEAELPVADAVAAYPFNSQALTLRDGTMTILAPIESQENAAARGFLERVVAGDNPVTSVHYLDLRQSMHNGGGPACLRQRVVLTAAERAAVTARVFFDDALGDELEAWVRRHYRDRLSPKDLADPALAREAMTAQDELMGILGL
jgi:succinylarginine dihydrolase